MKIRHKITFLSVFIFGIFIFGYFLINSLNTSFAIDNVVDSSGFPTSGSSFTTNYQETTKTKNYIKDALSGTSGVSDSYLNNFDVVENLRTSDEKYPLYSLMKNLKTPVENREFFDVGTDNSPSTISDNGLLYILSHGYNTSNTVNDIFSTNEYGSVTDVNLKQYITQISLWLYIYNNKSKFADSYCMDDRCVFYDGSTAISYDGLISKINDAAKGNYRYLGYITKLVSNAEGYTSKQTSKMTDLSGIYLRYEINEVSKKITTDAVTPTATGNTQNYLYYSVTISDPNNYGVYLIDSNTNKKIDNLSSMSGSFKVVVPFGENLTEMDLTSVSIAVTGNFIKDEGKAYVVNRTTDTETNYPLLEKQEDGNKTQKYTDILFGYVPTEKSSTGFSLYNFSKISKIDVTNSEELANAKLEIYELDDSGKRKSDTPIEAWISGTTAHYTVLDEGHYELCETVAPEGYTLETECVKFDVTDNNITATVMENTPYVPVPDTASFQSTKLYMLGISLVVIGVIGIIIVLLNQNKYVKQQ